MHMHMASRVDSGKESTGAGKGQKGQKEQKIKSGREESNLRA
jgi:hypothetical protein